MRRDGTEFPVELVVTRPEVPGDRVFYGYLRDLTARNVAEAALHRLADEQAALRRVATAVAAESDPSRLFALVGEEVGRLLEAQTAHIFRFDSDGARGHDRRRLGAAARAHPAGRHADADGRRHRRDAASGAPAARRGWTATRTPRASSPRSCAATACARSVAAPIFLGGALWGAVIVSSMEPGEPFPEGAEQRIAVLRRAGRAGAGQRERARGAGRLARPHRAGGRRGAPAAGAQPARRRAAAARVARADAAAGRPPAPGGRRSRPAPATSSPRRCRSCASSPAASTRRC